MDMTTLGRTGLQISKLSLGGVFVAGGEDRLPEGTEVVRKAYELGINYIDTAPTYGQSEIVLGQIFQETGPPAILSTKLGGGSTPFDAQCEDTLKASIERSLERLGVDTLPLVMVHEPERVKMYNWWTDMLKVEGPVLKVLADYQRQGIIQHIGLGGTAVSEMAHLVRSGKFDVVLTAFNYSLLWREAEDTVIAAARETGTGIIAGSPLQQGALACKHDAVYDDSVFWLHPARRQQFKDLYDLSDDLGMSLPEMSIRFVLSNADIATVLMGARTPAEVEANVAAVEAGPLPADVLARIDAIAARVPFRPSFEPAGLGVWLRYPGNYQGLGPINY